MRLRLSELLDERGMTAYALHRAAGKRLSLSAAYRLVADEWQCLPRDVIDVLCDVLGVEPGDLFARDGKARRPAEKRKR